MIISVLFVPEDGEIASVVFVDMNTLGTATKFKHCVKQALTSKRKMAPLKDYSFDLNALPKVKFPCLVEDHVTIFLEA